MDIIIERFHGNEIDYIEQWQNPHVAAGWRVASIRLNTMSFGSPTFALQTYAVAYHTANFNIVPPTLDEYLTSVYDSIGPLIDNLAMPSDGPYDDDHYYKLDEHNQEIASQMPSGWDTENLRAYAGHDAVPLHTINMMRLQWGVGVSDDEIALLHPSFDRLLTIAEYNALQANRVDQWLQQLKDLFYADHWKEQDWQSYFEAKQGMSTGTWVGAHCNGALSKQFNLIQFHPEHYREYDIELPVRRFNINENGKPIISWEQVERNLFEHKYGCRPIDYPIDYSGTGTPEYPLSQTEPIAPQWLHHRDENELTYRCKKCRADFNCLPKHCPGVPLTKEQIEGITNEHIDFKHGEWVEVDLANEGQG